MNDGRLNDYLRSWVREYGSGHDTGGGGSNNILQTLIDHKGFIPHRGIRGRSRTWGDDVEEVVTIMGRVQKPERGYGTSDSAKVLRVHYLIGSASADDERYALLAESGLSVRKGKYHQLLHKGRGFLGGWFSAMEIARR
jgi:hypothetical protein